MIATKCLKFARIFCASMLLLASGAAADRFGAKHVFRAAIALFVLGSLACGVAPTLPLIVAARWKRPTAISLTPLPATATWKAWAPP